MKREIGDIDDTDLHLLDLLQQDIPLVSEPWRNLGNQAGISTEEVLLRLNRLKDLGILRGITPTLESAKGARRSSTLIAVKVPEENIEAVAALVNQYDEVSHNFVRDHPYNLWFTLACLSPDRIALLIDEIQEKAGIDREDILDLTTLRKYKIHVTFPIMQREVRGDG